MFFDIKSGGRYMENEYREKIIELIMLINDEEMLMKIYTVAHTYKMISLEQDDGLTKEKATIFSEVADSDNPEIVNAICTMINTYNRVIAERTGDR